MGVYMKNKGFTLVEILAVIVIIAIIGAIGMIGVRSFIIVFTEMLILYFTERRILQKHGSMNGLQYLPFSGN